MAACGCSARTPPLVHAIFFGILFSIEILNDRQAERWSETVRISWQLIGAPILVTAVISVLLAIACHRRQSRYAASRRERITASRL
jgi:hypothetical protein